jgi:phage terminase large subunit
MPKDFNPRVHSGFKKLINPENEATVTGEAGDDIGRGGRKSIYFVDEAAFIQHQLSVDNALSQTTNCKIDISTYNGSGNEFYKKAERFKGTRRKFVCDWHDDPRKDEAWYTKQVENRNPVTVAQEIDRDPHASIAGILIPSKWVKAAIDLHKLIQIPPSGIRTTSFDPADEGLDPKGTLTRYGYVVTQCDIWVEGDITDALPRAYGTADQQNADVLVYDADGMGAPVIKTDLQYRAAGRTKVLPFYGSGAVEEPDMKYVQPGGDPKDPLLKANKDMFANYRAQKAIKLRDRFHQSYMIRKAIEKGGVALNVDTESIISIDSSVASFFDLETDISRPLEKWSPNGKFRVESKQEMAAREVDSPTGFDLLMMAFAQEAPRPQKRRKDRKVRRHAVRDRGVGM